MTLQIGTIEYLQEAMCRGEKDNCSCLNTLKKYIISDLNHTLNVSSRNKLQFKKNGGIVFIGCGKANQIIGVIIDNVSKLMQENNLLPEEIIQINLKQITDHVKQFKEDNNNDPYL